MRKKIAYAVFTATDSGLDYMVKGNFGNNEEAANKWAKDNDIVSGPLHTEPSASLYPIYPNGLFVKRIEY